MCFWCSIIPILLVLIIIYLGERKAFKEEFQNSGIKEKIMGCSEALAFLTIFIMLLIAFSSFTSK